MSEAGRVSTGALRTNVADLVALVREGRIRIPVFQRRFRWGKDAVRKLCDSILKGYPVGTLRMWQRAAEAERLRFAEGALEVEAGARSDAWFVVDGQQRIVSLAASLAPTGDTRAPFDIAYDVRSGALVTQARRDDAWVMPLPTLFDLSKLIEWFAERPDAGSQLGRASAATARLRQYELTGYVVSEDQERVLREVFDRLNNYGKRLNRAEVFTALHGAADSFDSFRDLAELVLAEEPSFGLVPESTLLYAFLARRGPDPSRDIHAEFGESGESGARTSEFPRESKSEAFEAFRELVPRVATFFQETAGIPHIGFLPYQFVFVTVARFLAHFPDPHPRNLVLLRRWVWRASALGPQAMRGGGTAAMRNFGRRIEPGEETRSVLALLGELAPLPRAEAFEVDRPRPNAAVGKIAAGALWDAGPRRPDGERYTPEDLRRVIDAANQSAPTPTPALTSLLVSGKDVNPLGSWFLLPEVDKDPDETLAALIGPPGLVDPALDQAKAREVLDSHFIDADTLRLLRARDVDAAAAWRGQTLVVATQRFVNAMAEWDAEDTPPLDSLIMDETEEGAGGDRG
jgi:hypothetical protein